MKTEFKPAVLRLKMTLCHILPVAEGLGKYIYKIDKVTVL